MSEYTQQPTEPADAADDHAAADAARRTAAYSEVYRTRNRQLVAYATSLVGDALRAEELVAQAHFRVWRQLSAGYETESVPAHLTRTLRSLATSPPAGAAISGDGGRDPERYGAKITALTNELRQLSDRSVRALWQAQVEGLSADTADARIGTNRTSKNDFAELGQAALQHLPGSPESEECAPYWERLPSIVHGTASAHDRRHVMRHVDACEHCDARLAVLRDADSRFARLLGPALLAAVLGGGAAWASATLSGTTPGAAVEAATETIGVIRSGTPRSGARHARVKANGSGRTAGRLMGKSATPAKRILVSSIGVVGIAAAATAVSLAATSSHGTGDATASSSSVRPTTSVSTVLASAAASAAGTTGSASASQAASSAAITPTSLATLGLGGTTPLESSLSQIAIPTQPADTVTQTPQQARTTTTGAATASSTGSATGAGPSSSPSTTPTAPATSSTPSGTSGSPTTSTSSTPTTTPTATPSTSATATPTGSIDSSSSPTGPSSSPSTSASASTGTATAAVSASASSSASTDSASATSAS